MLISSLLDATQDI